jgi:uncharacterized protein YcnI
VRRIAIVMGTVAVAIVATAGSAWAHVTVQPSEGAQGSFTTLTYQVPNEKDNANTTKLVITFPKDQPIVFASVQPVPGWTASIAKAKLDAPVEEHGESISEQLSTVTWTAESGGGIKPGEFQQFKVSLQLPESGESLATPAAQTYSDGDTVDWNQATPAGGPEPDYPQPEVTLTASSGDEHGGGTTDSTVKDDHDDGSAASTVSAAQDDVDSAKTMGTIGLVVGIVAILIAIAALVMARRKPEVTS